MARRARPDYLEELITTCDRSEARHAAQEAQRIQAERAAFWAGMARDLAAAREAERVYHAAQATYAASRAALEEARAVYRQVQAAHAVHRQALIHAKKEAGYR